MDKAKSEFLTKRTFELLFFNEYDPTLQNYSLFFLSLHSGAPVLKQTDREVSYPGYKRAPLLRSREWWVVRGREAWNKKEVFFPEVRRTYLAVSHFALGTHSEGEGEILYIGTLEKTVVVQPRERLTPTFLPGDVAIIED